MSDRPDNIADPGWGADELDEIEALIAGTETPSASPSIPNPPPPPPAVKKPWRQGRRPRKKELVEMCEAHRDTYMGDFPTPSGLRAMRVAQLEEFLTEIESPKPTVGAAAAVDTEHAQANAVPPIQIEQLMYFTLVNVAAVAENLSQQTAPFTGVVIEGAAQQIKQDEAELKPLLAGVYLEHQKEVQPYMTPTTILMTYLARVGSENVKASDGKKKGSSRESSRPLQERPEQQSTEPPSGSA
jgi:hypothetical protein